MKEYLSNIKQRLSSVNYALIVLTQLEALPGYLSWTLQNLNLIATALLVYLAYKKIYSGDLFTATWIIGLCFMILGINIAVSFYANQRFRGGE